MSKKRGLKETKRESGQNETFVIPIYLLWLVGLLVAWVGYGVLTITIEIPSELTAIIFTILGMLIHKKILSV